MFAQETLSIEGIVLPIDLKLEAVRGCLGIRASRSDGGRASATVSHVQELLLGGLGRS